MKTPSPTAQPIPVYLVRHDCSPGQPVETLKRATGDYVPDSAMAEMSGLIRPTRFLLWDEKSITSWVDPGPFYSNAEVAHTKYVGLIAKHFNLLGLVVGVIQQIEAKQYYFDFYHPGSRKLIKIFAGGDPDAAHFLYHPDPKSILFILDSEKCVARGKKKTLTEGVLHRPLASLAMQLAKLCNAHVIDGDVIWRTMSPATRTQSKLHH